MRDFETSTTGTSLDWFNVRHMSGGQGRFQSVDPANAGAVLGNPQSWNGYAYVANNPMTFTDPTGLYCYYQQQGYDGTAAGQQVLGETQADQTFCGNNGGIWIPLVNTTVTVNGDTGDASYDASIIGDSGTVSGGGGGGGGAGTGQSVVGRLSCAAKFGSNHSLASMLGLGDNYVANLFGGNTISGLTNLGLSVAGQGGPPDFAKMVAGGASLGIPINDALRLSGQQTVAGLTSVTGTVRAAGLRALFNTATQPAALASIAAEGGEIAPQGGISAAEYASGAAIAKFVFDAATFGYGYVFACGN